ncbi:MAG TPA: hypothetical protein VK498_12050 [Ferruginibacter sp.]|nr:hypothetical protein [Ferruginibacter sp.]
MKKSFIALGVFLICFLSSCEVIGGIFKAGVWSGVLLIVAIVAIVVFLLARVFNKK